MFKVVVITLMLSQCSTVSAVTDGSCSDPAELHSARCHTDDSSKSDEKFTLTYFDGRGLAELSRYVFALAGKFPPDGYTDVRLNKKTFAAGSATGAFKANLGRVPILEHKGRSIGQSGPVARFLAKEFGLMGADAWEAAEIEGICEHVTDVKAAFKKVVGEHETPGADKADKEANLKAARQVWFNTPSHPVIEGRRERQLQW